MTTPSDEQFPRPSNAVVADSERIHRAWLRGEDTAPGAYDDAVDEPTAANG